MHSVRGVALVLAVVALSSCGNTVSQPSVATTSADDSSTLPPPTVPSTPVAPDPPQSAACPGSDPLAVAAAFLTAVRAGEADLYGPCIYPGSLGDGESLLSNADWVSIIQSGDYQLDDEFERLPNMFSFGSPDLPPCTCAFNSYIDPNGRADITVTLEPDDLYYVSKLGIEAHG